MADGLANTGLLWEPLPKSPEQRLEETAIAPIVTFGRSVWLAALVLAAIVVWGAFAWLTQTRDGLQVTGLNCPVFWGIYITNFVFFVGISHAGTLISAILRITGADWRRPITRMAEAITVFALVCGPINIIFDLGRPDRMLNVFRHPHFASPILWDVCCISVYLIGSLTYLYLPLVPDLALLRERAPRLKWLYRALSFWWTGSERQWHFLERAIAAMAIIIIPIAVSVHTVVSYVFAMTIQPMWHSAIFGPYFVVGAIYSGIAALIVAMAILRWLCRLEDYLQPSHFIKLGWLLLTMCLLWFYFTFGEFLTTFYGQFPDEMRVFEAKMYGAFALPFWAMVVCMVGAFFVITLPLVPVRLQRPQSVAAWALRPVAAGLIAGLVFYLGSFGRPHHIGAAVMEPTWSSLLYQATIVLALGYMVWSFMPLLRDRAIGRMVIASILVNIGMWLERYTIVVPTLSNPRLPWGVESYSPRWVEWSIMAGLFALFSLLFLLFAKLFPLLPIWEMKQNLPAPQQVPEPSASGHGGG
ncbi:MAG: polysulfide reductase NrfD [Armatimonadetes bacterium]|nr:polysulfide reductase NrfD [Armatimonadota bacterium]